VKPLALAVLGVALAAAEPPAVEVMMPGRFYSPAEVSALLGTKVTFRNSDAISHTVTADNDSFDSGFIPPGATFTQTFTASGVYRFHCTIHRFMRGTLRIYAVVLTGPDQPLLVGRRVQLSGLAPEGTAEVVLEQLKQERWSELARRAPAEDRTYAFSVRAREPALYRTRAGSTASPVVRRGSKPKWRTAGWRSRPSPRARARACTYRSTSGNASRSCPSPARGLMRADALRLL
jgi:plastocyanin